MGRGRSKTKDHRVSQIAYADLTEAPDYKLRLRISELVDSVKKAFKAKRRRDCISIAKTIIELEPHNEDARFILSWIDCDLERDLQLARALLPDLKKDESIHKNAQLIVQTVLDIDPGNRAAEALRLEIESIIEQSDSPPNSPFDPAVEAQPPVIVSTVDAISPVLDSVRDESPSSVVEDSKTAADSVTEILPESQSAPQTQSEVRSAPASQPHVSAVQEGAHLIHPEPKTQPESDVVAKAQSPVDSILEPRPQVDRVLEAKAQIHPAPQVQPQVPKPPGQGAIPQAKPQFQPISRPQPQVDSFVYDDQYPIPEPKFWKREYIVIGLLLIVGILALVRYVRMPDSLTSNRDISGTTDNSSNATTDSTVGGPNAASALGDVEIIIDEGVEVFINGQYAGRAPIAPIRSRPGVYELRYKFDQMDIGSEKLTVTPGQVTRNSIRAVLGSLEIFVLPSSATVMQIDDNPAAPAQTHVVLKPGRHRLTFTAAGYQPQTVFATVTEGRSSNVTVILQPVIIGSAPATSSSPPAIQTTVPGRPGIRDNTSANPSGKGTLAISSLLPVDIYLDNNHVGTTPITLELPAGTYNFEYQYGNLRKTGINVIKSNELTRATVVFETTVQINSMPQAEVSLAGNQGKVLGQTPLTSVRVPIGSTLVFRTPGRPEKSYTVTEKDTTISMVFP